MANKEILDHKCVICGELYHACDNCERVKNFTPWKTVCDTHKHYEIYLIIKAYKANIKSKDDARQELAAKGLTKNTYANWPIGTKKVLDEIFYVPQPYKKHMKKNTISDSEKSINCESIETEISE